MSHPPLKLSSPATREFWELPVPYEDAELLAVDKPSRLLSSPDRYDKDRPSLMGMIHRDLQRAAPWTVQRQLTYLANVHRLDFETSGLLLLAKSKPSLVNLVNQFGAKKPVKQYLTLVHGWPEEDAFEVNVKLAPHPERPELMVPSPKRGKFSVTRFKVLERFVGYALLECEPLTGRTHQIRVHLKTKGLPVVGDKLYGGQPMLLSEFKPDYRLKPGREEQPLISRVALHAWKLQVTHPVSGEPVAIETELAKDLRVALKYLRQLAKR